MTLARAVDWLHLRAWPAVCAAVFGCPVCCGCSDVAISTKSAYARGWRWTTCFDGDAHWRCIDCQLNDCDPIPY